MKMNFVESGIIAQGEYPDFVQYPNTSGQMFYIEDGKLFGDVSGTFNGEFDNPVFLETRKMTRDMAIQSLEMKTLAGYGVIGSYLLWNSYKSEYMHKLVLCNYDDLLHRLF